MSDPWKNRSTGMQCRTCMSFVVKEAPIRELAEAETTLYLGRCRRHAPTMQGYPAVFPTDWCGDHKIDETKI